MASAASKRSDDHGRCAPSAWRSVMRPPADGLAAASHYRREVAEHDTAAAAHLEHAAATRHRDEAKKSAPQSHLATRAAAGFEPLDELDDIGLRVEGAPGIGSEHGSRISRGSGLRTRRCRSDERPRRSRG